MEAAAPIVKFTSLKKRYGGGPVVLDDISLSVTSAGFAPTLNEVTTMPELTTWAEMTFGMLFVGAFLRRRRLQLSGGMA